METFDKSSDTLNKSQSEDDEFPSIRYVRLVTLLLIVPILLT